MSTQAILQGKYPQAVQFPCPNCGYLIQIVRSMLDIQATGYTCQGCQLAGYRVMWGEKPEETTIERKW
jgi:predicted RNA-binding Zn-ribbon protein involved in translation (DUF1610 family)